MSEKATERADKSNSSSKRNNDKRSRQSERESTSVQVVVAAAHERKTAKNHPQPPLRPPAHKWVLSRARTGAPIREEAGAEEVPPSAASAYRAAAAPLHPSRRTASAFRAPAVPPSAAAQRFVAPASSPHLPDTAATVVEEAEAAAAGEEEQRAVLED